MDTVNKLSSDDLTYHAKLVRDLEAIQAIWNHWVGHLTEKYALQPGEQITPDGTIQRKAPEQAELKQE